MADQPRAALSTDGESAMPDEELTLDGVKEALHERGFRWHAFGSRSHQGEDGVLRYWFNGSWAMGVGHGTLRTQPSGWFTLEEMLAERFAEGHR